MSTESRVQLQQNPHCRIGGTVVQDAAITATVMALPVPIPTVMPQPLISRLPRRQLF